MAANSPPVSHTTSLAAESTGCLSRLQQAHLSEAESQVSMIEVASISSSANGTLLVLILPARDTIDFQDSDWRGQSVLC